MRLRKKFVAPAAKLKRPVKVLLGAGVLVGAGLAVVSQAGADDPGFPAPGTRIEFAVPPIPNVPRTFTTLKCPSPEPLISGVFEISPNARGAESPRQAVHESVLLRNQLPRLPFDRLVPGKEGSRGQAFAILDGSTEFIVYAEQLTTFPDSAAGAPAAGMRSWFVTGLIACAGVTDAGGAR